MGAASGPNSLARWSSGRSSSSPPNVGKALPAWRIEQKTVRPQASPPRRTAQRVVEGEVFGRAMSVRTVLTGANATVETVILSEDQ